MKRVLLLAVGLMMVAFVLVAPGCSPSEADQGGEFEQVSRAESESIAREYVLNSPTFGFDGMEETLKLVATNTMRCPCCWEFVFEFDGRHSGYGDRTGLVLLQVITPHTARIVVQEGDVASAVLDGKWDMTEQGMISGQ